MNSRKRRLTLAAAALAAAPSVSHGAVVTFFDGDLASVNWTIFTMMSGNGGSTTSTLVTTDGNPPDCRQIDHTINTSPGAGFRSVVFSVHLRNGATYDPATQGSIGHICFTEWVKQITTAGDVQAVGPALRQGGTVFRFVAGTAAVVPWTPRMAAGTEIDFVAIDPGDAVDGLNQSSHPDFSSAGGLIELGFCHANSTGLGGGPYMTSAFVDNWTMTIVPGPPCLGDLNGDGVINSSDLALLLGAWGPCP